LIEPVSKFAFPILIFLFVDAASIISIKTSFLKFMKSQSSIHVFFLLLVYFDLMSCVSGSAGFHIVLVGKQVGYCPAETISWAKKML